MHLPAPLCLSVWLRGRRAKKQRRMAKGMAVHSIELQKGIPFAEHHSGKPLWSLVEPEGSKQLPAPQAHTSALSLPSFIELIHK